MTEAGGELRRAACNGDQCGECASTSRTGPERHRSAADVAVRVAADDAASQPGMLVQTRVSSGIFRAGAAATPMTGSRVEIRGHDMAAGTEYAEQVRAAMATGSPARAIPMISQRPGHCPRCSSASTAPRPPAWASRQCRGRRALETAVGGRRASMFREDGDEYDILVRLREQDRLKRQPDRRRSASTLARRPTVPAATLVRSSARKARSRSAASTSSASSSSAARSSTSATSAPSSDDLRERHQRDSAGRDGYEFIFGGEYEEQQEAFREHDLRRHAGARPGLHGHGRAV